MTNTPNLPTLTRDANGTVRASSLEVAERFGKRHADVLRAIDDLISQLETTQRNFAFSEYRDPTGRALRCVTMDRDGFTLLAMGFTGADALKWKLAYIQAFNAMEATLATVTPEQALVSLGVEPAAAAAIVANHRDTQLALAQSTRALELATIAEAKAQATALACQDYSIMAYSRLCNIPVDLTTARALGIHAANLSRARGLPIGQARDPRFGSVNTYIESVFTAGL